MKVRAFITHKLCESYADCQDRFNINENNRIIGLSDGMSQSIFPDYWAEILSEQYAKEGHCDEEDRKRLCPIWMQRVIQYRNRQIEAGKNPWKLDNFLATHKGAGATICGVRFENATDWKGDVLGDSCIIRVNKKDWSIDVLSSEERAFDSYPDYYDSFPERAGRGTIKPFEGSIGPDDLLLLVSDPFSEYLTNNNENIKELIEKVLCLDSHASFCNLVDDWRNLGMHNDDSTLCIIEFDNRIDFNIQYQDKIEDLIANENNKASEESVPIVNQEQTVQSENNITEDNKNDINNNQSNLVESIEENEAADESGLEGKIIEIRNWILNKIDDILKGHTKPNHYNSRFHSPNKGIPKKKIEQIRNDIVAYFDQMMK